MAYLTSHIKYHVYDRHSIYTHLYTRTYIDAPIYTHLYTRTYIDTPIYTHLYTLALRMPYTRATCSTYDIVVLETYRACLMFVFALIYPARYVADGDDNVDVVLHSTSANTLKPGIP
jgi:hypothetical protein